MTYAVAGDSFKYWDFFPAPDGFGIVPMWGHARVIESHCPDIAVGERVYGYLPMASHLDVVPGRVSAGGFLDTTDYRQPMSPVYNSYTRLAADPEHDPAREAERMIFGPLFRTGFLIEYFLRGAEWFGAEQLVVTSADGRWLAYVSRIGGAFKLFVLDLQSGQSNPLTDTTADESPSFAPNSRMIVYATRQQGREALMTTTVDGRIKTRLASAQGDIREPEWGPFVR